MLKWITGVAIVTGLLFYSCGKKKDDDPSPILPEDSLIVAYLDTMGIAYQVDDNGIYSYPIVSNPGGTDQGYGKILGIYYELSVLNGPLLERYDSLDGPPRRLKQGVAAVYPVGIDHALVYMKEGETWGFVIPSALGYVDYSSALIPENAILELHATLVSIQNETDIRAEENDAIIVYVDSLNLTDSATFYPYNNPRFLPSGVLFHQRAYGSGSVRPNIGNEVTITYTASFPYIENEPFDVAHNTGANAYTYDFRQDVVITGLDDGVGEMTRGERAVLVIPSGLGYRESVRVFPQYSQLIQDLIALEVIPTYAGKVGPYEILIFDVRLLDVL